MKDLFRRPAFALLALIILAILGTALYDVNMSSRLPARLGGPELLETTQGKVPLSRVFGPVTVVFFGFTQCPDVCPTTLSVVSRAVKALPASQQSQLNVLFVTLDPERDTLEIMRPYTQFFSDRVMGIRLSEQDLERWVRTFHVFYEKVPLPASQMGYTINHTAAFFIIREGHWPGQIMTSHDVGVVTQALAQAFR